MNKQILRFLRNKGLLTVPIVIRRMLDLKPNDILSFTVIDDNTFAVKRETLCGAPCKNRKGAKRRWKS